MVTNAFRSIPMAMHRYDVNSRVSLCHGTVRTAGFVAIAVAGLGVWQVILWDLVVAAIVLCVYVVAARQMMPALRWVPRVSFSGLREIFGYSVYSFMTQIFLSVYRESGKLVLGNHIGPSGVAYLGTPDSIAYRIYMVVVSGVETLMPRFSASRDPQVSRSLVAMSTQAALWVAAILFVPLGVLMHDFLRLWINADFAGESAAVGRLLALSFIAPAAFAPIATFFRGTGKPGFVTVVLAGAGLVVIGSSVLLVASQGAAAVGVGYLLSSVAWLGGLVVGWRRLFGRESDAALFRMVGVPIVLSGAAFFLQSSLRSQFGELSWFGLVVLGAMFSLFTGALVCTVDWLLGASPLLRRIIDSCAESARIRAVVDHVLPGERRLPKASNSRSSLE
jgi:O-antigen/teichoic acid export membrane protein